MDAGAPDAGFLDALSFYDWLVAAECTRAAWCEFKLLDARELFTCHPADPVLAYERALIVRALRTSSLSLDQDLARRCMAFSLRAPCETARLLPEECWRALEGARAPGELCATHFECAPGLRCRPIESTCGGSCVALLGEGERCFPGDCLDGLLCSLSPEPRCARPAGDGEPCGFGVGTCSPDLICTRAGDCAHRSGSGEPCAFDGQCEGDLVCPSGSCVEGRRAGDECSASARCGAGTRCVEGRCRAVALPAEPCTPECACVVTHSCFGGLCEPRAVPGEACRSETGCMIGECTRGRCPQYSDGSPCAPGRGGELDACLGYCDGRVDECRPRNGPGEPCSGWSSCVDGYGCTVALGCQPLCI